MGIDNINAVVWFISACKAMIRSQNYPKLQLSRQIYHGLGCVTKIFPVITTKRLEIHTRVAAQSAFGKVHDVRPFSFGHFHLTKNKALIFMDIITDWKLTGSDMQLHFNNTPKLKLQR
jgi:hypothetical protein